MRLEMRICLGITLFEAVCATIYWFWSRESGGTVWFIFGGCAFLLIGTFLSLQLRRRQGIPRPEDNEYAEQSDGAGEIGYFPAASIWPAGMGLGAIFIAVGTIYGVWYWVIGGVLMLGAIIGYVVEAEAREEGPADPGMPVDPDPGEGSTPIVSADAPRAAPVVAETTQPASTNR